MGDVTKIWMRCKHCGANLIEVRAGQYDEVTMVMMKGMVADLHCPCGKITRISLDYMMAEGFIKEDEL